MGCRIHSWTHGLGDTPYWFLWINNLYKGMRKTGCSLDQESEIFLFDPGEAPASLCEEHESMHPRHQA